MLKKNAVIISLILLSVLAFMVYQWSKVPEGVVPMSDQAEKIALISLWTSVVALLTAIVGLIEKMLGRNKSKEDESK